MQCFLQKHISNIKLPHRPPVKRNGIRLLTDDGRRLALSALCILNALQRLENGFITRENPLREKQLNASGRAIRRAGPSRAHPGAERASRGAWRVGLGPARPRGALRATGAERGEEAPLTEAFSPLLKTVQSCPLWARSGF